VAAGTFTFLFTDIEGSTPLLGRVGQDLYAQVLADHHSVIRSGLAAHGGREVDTQGDAFFAGFSSPAACVAAVIQMQQALAAREWPGGERVRVRMGVHTGEASVTAAGLVGLDVHRAARVAAAGNGGQVLVSETSAMLVREVLPPGAALADLGVHRLKDLDHPVRIFQLTVTGLQAEFPPLRTVPGGVAAATRTLPRDLVSFTGRQREVEQLVEAAVGAAGPGGVVGIHAIGGMAGVGKTALAVHAAHRVAPRFPGGQIFLPLHGHTPGHQPVDPADALASLLLTSGVPAGRIPPGLEARMALWRDRLAERQLLLILDDAASSEQVRPLLPGAGGSVVLVTSRRHLSAPEDATTVSLDTLPPEEAAALLARLAGRPGLTQDDPAVREMTRLCGYLPLAIGMVARQLHHHPAWSAAGRVAELATVDRLELMATENLSVAAAFNLSYENLPGDQQQLFRRLGLHPGPDVDGYAAAALNGTGLAAGRRGLEALYDQYLLAEPARGRYRLHDLIREHARALADRIDPEPDRDQATARLLDYYQYAAALADALVARQARPVPAHAAAVMSAAVPALAHREQALAWARAERANMIACLDHVTGTGQHARIIAFTAGLAGLLRQDGPWAEAITRHATAVRAARHLGDRLGQANILDSLGTVREQAGELQGAARAEEQALGIYRDIGDRLGEANALLVLGVVRQATGDLPGAVRDLGETLGIYQDIGNRLGQAIALTVLGDARQATGDFPGATRDLEEALAISSDIGHRSSRTDALRRMGKVRRLTGDLPGAARDLEEALAISRDMGDRAFEVEALNEAGTLARVSGDLRQAGSCHQHALDLARQIGSSWEEARALAGLGRCALAVGHPAEAADMLQQALETFQRIGAAEAADVSAELQALTDPRPAAHEP
jgi:class 3 adenylate cyclase/tetratricopeptide (TPR) repeat protein